MTRILSVSSSRADVGHLTMVWRALASRRNVDLHILLTGMHVADATFDPSSLPDAATIHRGGADLGGDAGDTAARAMASIGEFTGAVCGDIQPDLVVVFGDRLDMVPTAVAVLPFGVPLAHLHGGELSLGAVDDRIRHALTKLAHLHCVSNSDAAHRVNSMGEEPWRIHVTGAPGLDTLYAQEAMTDLEVATKIGVEAADLAKLRLVTVHPETVAPEPLAPCDAVLDALERLPGPTLLTAPNADPGGAAIRQRIEAFAAAHPRMSFRDTLGSRLYANVMRRAAVMVGNSSSGIVEAGLFGLPVIDVGCRQRGRLAGANVRNCSADPGAIGRLLARIDHDPAWRTVDTPYGDGHAAERVAGVLTEVPHGQKLLMKQFSDESGVFPAPWDAAAAEGRRIDAVS